VFENRALRRIFVPEREVVAGCWRRLHNDEVHNSPNIIGVIESRRVRLVVYGARMGEVANVYNTLVGEPEPKRLLRRTRHRQ
jgi:hypothetical protein